MTKTSRELAAVWLVVAVVFGVLLVIVEINRGPLDDPDQAYQRPGILDLAVLPEPAPPVTNAVPAPGRPAVVFFDRPTAMVAICEAVLDSALPQRADLAIVTTGPAGWCGSIPVVSDPDASLAERYGMRTPSGGGPPVGYAVVDTDGRIRYRTLDPTVPSELSEVHTMLGAL